MKAVRQDYLELKRKWAKELPSEGTGRLRTISAAAVDLATLPSAYQHGMMWGPWRLDLTQLTLTHISCYGGNNGYEIDLEKLTSCGRMLDTIFQVAKKTWCSTADAGCLLAALEDLLKPQAHLCSFGAEEKFDVTRFLTAKKREEQHLRAGIEKEQKFREEQARGFRAWREEGEKKTPKGSGPA